MSEPTERKYPYEPKAPAVLAVDVGGSHVKTVLNGIDERRRSIRSGWPARACTSVWMRPGRTAFTRMPSSATSLARPIVNVSIAPFEAA